MNFISDFGDAAVLLPLALFLIAALWRYQSWAAAICLIQALGLCVVVLVLLKIAFIACGMTWRAGVSSPSGHAGMSVMVYGSLGAVAARQSPRWRKPVLLLAVWLLVAAIAVSRVALGAHSYGEVLIGMSAGVAALCCFLLMYRKQSGGKMNWSLLAMIVCVGLPILHGMHVPAENLIRHLALTARSGTDVCPNG